MRKRQDIIFTFIIGHGKRKGVMVVLSEIGVQFHVLAEIVHPSHVPLKGKAKAVVLYLPRYLRPCR